MACDVVADHLFYRENAGSRGKLVGRRAKELLHLPQFRGLAVVGQTLDKNTAVLLFQNPVIEEA
jgi:hypothetical protein